MAASKSNDRLSYGITILIFGVLFLLDKLHILDKIPYGNKFISVGMFFLIAGIVFLFTQPKKVLGWVFLGVGILLNADTFFGWMSSYSNLIVPLGLIIAGVAMVLTANKKKS
ncbi:MAG: LiaF transmembrane domain-containing protein [Dysgonomonas sp.]